MADQSDEFDLAPARVKELLDAGDAKLIDVRLADELDSGTIDGSVHIELQELGERAGEIPQDSIVIFACGGGNRSALAAEAFRATGHDARHIEGGIRAWIEAGLPLEKS
jgi:hydroxyacylglutathione hydrolase/adenylyltransferase/sulfurtransferase